MLEILYKPHYSKKRKQIKVYHMYTTNKMSWLNAGEGSCDIVTQKSTFLHYEPLTHSGRVNDFRFNII